MEVKTRAVPSLFIPETLEKVISHTRYKLTLRSWKPLTLRSITGWQN